MNNASLDYLYQKFQTYCSPKPLDRVICNQSNKDMQARRLVFVSQVSPRAEESLATLSSAAES